MRLMIAMLLFGMLPSGCASECPKCRAELAALRDEVARLREDISAVNALVSKPPEEIRQRRSTVVIGRSKETVEVQVHARKIIIDGRAATLETLSSHAARIAEQRPQVAVAVRALDEVEYDRVVQVLDMLKRAGLQRIYLKN
jgi:biopolymer transport protein ExbD